MPKTLTALLIPLISIGEGIMDAELGEQVSLSCT
jgi:hypothetical protein